MIRLAFTILLVSLCSQAIWAHDDADLSHPELAFIENKGQRPDQVLYEAPIGNNILYLESNRWTYQMINRPHNHGAQRSDEKAIGHVFRMWFEDANDKPHVSANYPREDYVNYFLGNDPNKWASFVQQYQIVHYEDLYDCIDMSVYSKFNNPKYDFIVREGGNPDDIDLRFEGMNKLSLEQGNLVLQLATGQLTELAPYAYQLINGKEQEVACHFVLKGDRVHFELPEGFDPKHELIIDPTLVFSSYVGSTADSFGFTAANDDDGHLYGGSLVFASGYPTTVGEFDPYDASFNGGNTDWGITKFKPDGTSLVYSTYIGGSGGETPHSLIINKNNDLVILGTTGSLNFPTTSVAFGQNHRGGSLVSVPQAGLEYLNGSDYAITVLDENGGSLQGSTYFGGSGNDGVNETSTNSLRFNYGDVTRGEVIVDDDNNIYIGGCTVSTDIQNSSIYGAPAIQGSAGGQEGILAKFTPGLEAITWWSYIGGSDDDAIYSVKINEVGDLYTCGGTESADFPVGAGGLNPSYQGGTADGFVLRVNNDGSGIINGTFLGTTSYDQTFLIDVDENQDVYVVGQSLGSYEVNGAVYSNSGGRQFVHQLNATLSNTIISTVFGAGGQINIAPSALLVDVCDRIYISGWGGETNRGHNPIIGNTLGLPVTADAFQSASDGSDFYFIVFNKDLESLLYASYFGANGDDEHVDGGTSRFSKDGTIYQAVCAGCQGSSNFPTTPGAWSNVNLANNCNLGVIKFDFDPRQLSTGFEIEAPPVCGPYEVPFTNNTVIEGDIALYTFTWDFGDGSPPVEAFEPTHEYPGPGSYTAVLVVDGPPPCFTGNTAEVEVVIPEPPLVELELPPAIDGCTTIEQVFSVTETAQQYIWDFGDGETGSGQEVTHVFDEVGTYDIELIAIDSTACNLSDTATTQVTIFFNPTISYTVTEPPACVPPIVTITNNSIVEDDISDYTFTWDMGDGTILEGFEPTYEYSDFGDFDISLMVSGPSPCLPDSLVQTITIPESFYIDLEMELNDTACTSITEIFSTESQAAEYLWDFGDGTFGEGPTVTHEYDTPGIYDIVLIASDENACNLADTAYAQVQVFLQPNALFEASPATDLFVGQPLSFDNLSTPGMDYFWDFSGEASSTEFEPMHAFTLLDSVEVCLTVSNPGSPCDDVYCESYYIDFDFMIPGAFSPNGDGINEEWGSFAIGLPEMRVVIFNRWGEKIFDADPRFEKWDGTYKEKPQELGVYLYWIEAIDNEGKFRFEKGNITLIR